MAQPTKEAEETENFLLVTDKNDKFDKIYSTHRFEIWTIDEVADQVNDRVHQLSKILGTPPQITYVIINHFDWDEETAISKTKTDRRKVFKTIGVRGPNRKIVKRFKRFVKDVKQMVKGDSNHCKTCFARVYVRNRTTLKCMHKYCTMCWNLYVRDRVLDHQESYTLTCPSPNCSVLIDYERIKICLFDEQTTEVYKTLNITKFVEANPLYNWCPNANCDKLVKVANVDEIEVTCFCGYKFCFKCLKECHNPINCDMLKKWQMKLIETDYDFKICPNCDRSMKSIENSNSNPNTTICSSCDIFYCPHCSGPNKVNQDLYSENSSHLILEDENTSMYLYQHYFKKYFKHKDILDSKKNLEGYIERKLCFFETYNLRAMGDLVNRILNAVFKCRKTLMYTYIFSYYLKHNSSQAKSFLDLQNRVELSVEETIEVLERIYNDEFDFTTLYYLEYKIKYCSKVEKMLHVAVYEGYENNSWEFIE